MQAYTTKQNDMIDLIAWRHYGHQRGTAEAILEANVGLADLSVVLPAGIVIHLPELPDDSAVLPQPLRLWD